MTTHDSETPALNRQVITACAFIHQEFDGVEKVFLPRRAQTKRFLPGVYEFPGGHLDFGEDIVVGLKREILEEFGLDIEVGDPFAAFTYINEVKGSHSVEVVYFARFKKRPEVIRLNPADHCEYGWFGRDEIGKILSVNKNQDDPEIKAMKKGFELLHGRGMQTA